DAAGLERSIDYVYYQHEILRALEVVSLAGASPVTLEPSIAPTPADLDAGQRLAADLPGPVLALHPGASDPRRRWPRAHFAQVAAWAVNAGASVVVLGGPGENRAVAEIVNAAGRLSDRARIHGAADLTMSELIGGLAVADVFLGNDSGPRHLAQALATPTASVFWFGNLINAGPFTRQHHRVQMSWTSRCPVCKQDATRVGWTATRCEHDDSFVADVPVEAVCADVGSLMAMRVRSRDK
ncbi:MAG TPA: glycosyltransferase family 9 protein, partial [Beutenbergiaceae bacterium]|nr:glycosyltransferase family 9 protein [Beutenbergiaceae bacterium]